MGPARFVIGSFLKVSFRFIQRICLIEQMQWSAFGAATGSLIDGYTDTYRFWRAE